ncbi:MAG: hypothetical protein AB9M53_06130 [Leptothrix sp. (in: b-proteobacteria)]
MSIEWGNTGFTSTMKHRVIDNNGQLPTQVLSANQPFQIEVSWTVPNQLISLVNPPGDQFRVRAYAESVGPGQEVQIGSTMTVPASPGASTYTHTLLVGANTLLGEGANFNGQAVSGLYKIACVLQHLSNGTPTAHSGYSDNEPMVMLKTP